MKILALETTERIGSLAIHDGDKLLAEKFLDDAQRTAQALAPGVRELLDGAGWKVRDLDLVAVTVGPGSFTGLRIGVTTAKTLAYAVGAEVLRLDTLAVIAAQTPVEFGQVAVAVDAQRGEVVAGTFTRREDGHFELDAPAELLSAEAWLAGLTGEMAVSGPIVGRLLGRVPSGVAIVDEVYRLPRAATVAELAARVYREGGRDDIWKLVPVYSRRSAAEERWEERHKKEM